MTSAERHEARYQRRKAKREEKRRQYLDIYDDFNRVSDFGAIVTAHFDTRCGVGWKPSVARYDSCYLKCSRKQSQDLKNGKFKPSGYNEFDVIERGKRRHIHSIKHYSERVVRRAACIEALVPILSRNLIYDNGASLKGRGTSFSAKRCEVGLHRYFRENGSNDGYVLTIDFKNYFGNIYHAPLFMYLDRYIRDPKLNALCKMFVRSTDETRPANKRGRGLFIGPEDSQIFAVAFPNPIDHKIKDGWRIKIFNRYMDDSNIVFRTKEEAHYYYNLLCKEYDKYGIVVNRKKTQIVKLRKGFTFLKTQYILTDSGKLIRKPKRKSITMVRRRLKGQKRLVDKGEMTVHQVSQSYVSARSSLLKRDAWRSVHRLDQLFYSLFGVTPWKTKKSKKRGTNYARK